MIGPVSSDWTTTVASHAGWTAILRRGSVARSFTSSCLRGNEMEIDPLNQGRLLRASLGDRIGFARYAGNLERHGKHRIIRVNEVVERHLPSGGLVSFDYAEGALRSAGFAVGRRPTSDQPCQFGDPSDVIADADFEGVKCFVVLRPARPFVFDMVDLVLTDCGFLSL
jgi:hypothetical protein